MCTKCCGVIQVSNPTKTSEVKSYHAALLSDMLQHVVSGFSDP